VHNPALWTPCRLPGVPSILPGAAWTLAISDSGTFSCPYSPYVLEGKFSEVREQVHPSRDAHSKGTAALLPSACFAPRPLLSLCLRKGTTRSRGLEPCSSRWALREQAEPVAQPATSQFKRGAGFAFVSRCMGKGVKPKGVALGSMCPRLLRQR
jgi:hypothetical protein